MQRFGTNAENQSTAVVLIWSVRGLNNTKKLGQKKKSNVRLGEKWNMEWGCHSQNKASDGVWG